MFRELVKEIGELYFNLYWVEPADYTFQIGGIVLCIVDETNDAEFDAIILEDYEHNVGEPLAEVRIYHTNTKNENIYAFVDKNGHRYLRFGTFYSEDGMGLYPHFIFEFTPRFQYEEILDSILNG